MRYKRNGQIIIKIKGYLWMLLLLITVCLLGRGFFEEYAHHKAAYYVSNAEGTESRQKTIEYYKKALLWSPGMKEIYEGIMENWVQSDSFSREDSMILFQVLEETKALKYLKFCNPKVYVEFSYKIGFACFYDQGKADGRKEAAIWFARALEKKKWLTEKQKKMARAWIIIGESEERGLEFFRALQELNPSPLPDSLSQKELEIAYKISNGILLDIREYCKSFLEETDLQARDLYYEVSRAEMIRKDSRYEIKQKQKEQLTILAADTRKRIRIMEEIHEKEE